MFDIALVMPIAGRGSRFASLGIKEPKPLIELMGRPFFWWAVESVRRMVPVREMVFVVLDEHCEQFAIHNRIIDFYPDARIVKIPDVTSGAAETAQIGLAAVRSNGPAPSTIATMPSFAPISRAPPRPLRPLHPVRCFVSARTARPTLMSSSARQGRSRGTVEKKVVSPYAIAGCYLFSNPTIFADLYGVTGQPAPTMNCSSAACTT